jgi:hypothetical protein
VGAESVTLQQNPFRLVRLIDTGREEPTGTVIDVGLTLMLKSII